MSQTLIIILTAISTLACVGLGYAIIQVQTLLMTVNDLWDALDRQNETIAMMQESARLNELKKPGLGGLSGIQLVKLPYDPNQVRHINQTDSEVDEQGRNRAWYIQKLNEMNAKFDSDESLEELARIYRLLE